MSSFSKNIEIYLSIIRVQVAEIKSDLDVHPDYSMLDEYKRHSEIETLEEEFDMVVKSQSEYTHSINLCCYISYFLKKLANYIKQFKSNVELIENTKNQMYMECSRVKKCTPKYIEIYSFMKKTIEKNNNINSKIHFIFELSRKIILDELHRNHVLDFWKEYSSLFLEFNNS